MSICERESALFGGVPIKRIVLIALGLFFVLLGGIGLVIPVLPTTPFALLAAGFFASSSPRMHQWLLNTRFIGEYLENYRTGAGVRRRTKAFSLAFLYAALGVSCLFVSAWWGYLLLGAVAAGVTIHIVCLKTKHPVNQGGQIMHKQLTPPAIAEIVFDVLYLSFAAFAGIFLLVRADGGTAALLYGILALVLCFGDAFHLLPRIWGLWTGTMEEHRKELAFGKAVTSVTMTVFYVILYLIWSYLAHLDPPVLLTVSVLALAVVRIVLCLLPGNRWFDENPSFRFAIIRNIPFAILGAVVAVAYLVRVPSPTAIFQWMPLAILLSFVFYFIVILCAGKHPKTGMFMIPKTCAYIWVLCMGFALV